NNKKPTMLVKEAPIKLEGINDNIYGGFWRRLGALLLDGLFTAPVIYFILYVNSIGKNVYFMTLLPNIAFTVFYFIFLPVKYNGTPGKIVMGLNILRLDGQAIGWKEAFLRHVVSLGLVLIGTGVMIYSLSIADDEVFKSLSWFKQQEYLMQLTPMGFKLFSWANNVWIWSEFIVLLTNPRRRAIHDFIAGTIIVRQEYVASLLAVMDTDLTTTESGANSGQY
ncbi:MAG TPA: RDD family protein, partial [Chitinophagales bacterium]|nr:RDD family protein [Chitinophagales bacterium]